MGLRMCIVAGRTRVRERLKNLANPTRRAVTRALAKSLLLAVALFGLAVQTAHAAPTANDDTATTSLNTPIVINVLANDLPDTGTNAPLVTGTVNVKRPIRRGIHAQRDGTVSFTPLTGSTTPETFTYTVRDNLGFLSNVATVTVYFDVAPNVSTVVPANTATNVALNSDVTITFNEAVTVSGNWMQIACPTSGNRSAVSGTAVSGGPTVYTINPSANFAVGETCTVTVTATQVADQDGIAPLNMTTNFTSSFSTVVNNAPSFTLGPDQTVNEDTGAQTVNPWATAINDGDGNTQTLTFNVTGNTNPGLFSAGPAISSTGVLTYTPAANQHGSATITLTLSDNGGTAGGGVDTSAAQSFVITVNAVNDAPVAAAKSYAAQANMKIVGLSGLLTGVTDADNGVSGCAPTFTVASLTSGAGGTVSNLDANVGSFDFDPNPGFTGTATAGYTVQDNGCPGSATSASAAISITVSGPVIWFVNTAAVGTNDGRLSNPFTSLGSVPAVDNANDRVFVYSGTYANGLALTSGEWLIGQGVTGTTFDALFGIAPPTGTISRPTINGTRPVLQNTVTLNTDAVVRGLDITTTGATALTDPAGANTGVTVNEVNISATTASAVSLDNLTGTLTFGTVSSSGGTNNIALTSVNGTVTLGNGALSGASARAIDINGGTATVSHGGTVSNSGTGIGVANKTGGTVTLSGTPKTLNTGTNGALTLANNSGATIDITGGGLAITATSGGGFSASGGGTVTVQGSGNTIATTTGTALNVANTTIGASDLTFQSISANGATNGIVLNTTGALGGLTVTGTGGTGTGGTIQNSTGPGISLTNTRTIALSSMNIASGDDDGIRGSTVTGLSLTGVQVTSNGNAAGEAGIDLANLFGTSTWSGITVSGSAESNAVIRNSSGTLTSLTVTSSTFSNNSSIGGDGFLMEASGTASMTASLTGNTFTANRDDHFQAAAANSGVLDVVFSNNTLSGGHATALGQGITVSAATGVPGYSGTVDYNVDNNTINGAILNAIIVNLGTSSSAANMRGTISGNTIGTVGSFQSGSAQGAGIAIDAHGNGTHTTLISNNTIRQTFDRGINVLANDGGGTLNVTVTGNNSSHSDGTNSREGFFINNGSADPNIFGVPDAHFVCLSLGGAGALRNTLTRGPGAPDDFRMRQRFNSTIRLPGYGGGVTDTAAVVAFVNGNNISTTGSATVNSPPGGGFVGGAACPTPP